MHKIRIVLDTGQRSLDPRAAIFQRADGGWMVGWQDSAMRGEVAPT